MNLSTNESRASTFLDQSEWRTLIPITESWLGYPGSHWEIFQFNLILFNVYTGAELKAGLALMVFMFECLAYSEYEVKLSPLMTNGGR